MSDLLEAWTGQPQVKFTVHPHCGAATYLFVDDNGGLLPITRFVDVAGLMESVKRIIQECEGSKHQKVLLGEKLVREVPRYVDTAKMPENVNIPKILVSFVRGGNPVKVLAEFHYKALLIGAMHFMDPYNVDLERVQSCGIHYATPDGRVIPFCTYNTLYRQDVEKKFAIPLKVEEVPLAQAPGQKVHESS
jgi:uncharacterized radical SAM superfamily Fe-S cluster-containing enzyme